MRKSLIALPVLVTAVFGIGYAIGQMGSITPSSAATSPPVQSPSSSTHLFFGHADRTGPRAGGKVTSVNGDTVTVMPFTDRDGQTSSITSIVLTGSTQYFAGPGSTANRDSIKAGSYIRAEGSVSSDGKTLTASRIMILPGAPGAGGWHGRFRGSGSLAGPHADGQVTAVNGNILTIKADADRAGSPEETAVTTITLTGSTQYLARHGAAASKSDIKVGAFIIAEGSVSADHTTLTASRIIIAPNGPGTHMHWGGTGSSDQSGQNV